MLLVVFLPVRFRHQWHEPFSVPAGLLLLITGGVLGIAGVRALGRNRTAFTVPREEGTLVRRGVYGRLRHPLYASVMLVALGWGLIWRSSPVLFLAVLLTALLNAKAHREERWLRAKFAEYQDYEKQVPRFLPRPR
jgi:protein-S-isoprenylcysteine O-methyltransferase Ste14